MCLSKTSGLGTYLGTFVDVSTVLAVRRQHITGRTFTAERANGVLASAVSTQERHHSAFVHVCTETAKTLITIIVCIT